MSFNIFYIAMSTAVIGALSLIALQAVKIFRCFSARVGRARRIRSRELFAKENWLHRFSAYANVEDLDVEWRVLCVVSACIGCDPSQLRPDDSFSVELAIPYPKDDVEMIALEESLLGAEFGDEAVRKVEQARPDTINELVHVLVQLSRDRNSIHN